MQVERMERDRRSADEGAAAARADLSAVVATKRTIEASFEKLDKARERTRTALQHSRSLRGAASMPGGDGAGLRPGSLAGESAPADAPLERSRSSAQGSSYRAGEGRRSPAKGPGHRRGLSGRVDFE